MESSQKRNRLREKRLIPSGEQYEIACGTQRAIIVEVGGGLRTYSRDNRELLDGYTSDEQCSGARGLPLVPWPNRIQYGTYTFDGVEYQVPLTEPEKHNAIHGLLRWRNWNCRRHEPDALSIGTVIYPQMGYPFAVDIDVTYSLSLNGLTVSTTATNIGDIPCPYGAGHHPYLSAGTGVVDACNLELDAGQWIPTDARGIPKRHADVAGSEYDFRGGRYIGDQEIDNTFTGLARDSDGLAWVHFTAPERPTVSMWIDEEYPFLELYTAHTQPAPHRRTGLGVEPMTCAPNAFRSGEGLIRLLPGESRTANWGLSTF